MTEVWDWRQSYAQYSDTIEDQSLQHAAPEGPEAVAPGHLPSAAPLGAWQESVRRPGSGPGGALFACHPPPVVANARGDRIGRWAGLMSIATTVLGITLSLWVAGNLGLQFGT